MLVFLSTFAYIAAAASQAVYVGQSVQLLNSTVTALTNAEIVTRDDEPYVDRKDGYRQNGLGIMRLESKNNSAFVVVACNDMPIVRCSNPKHTDNVPLHKARETTAYNPKFTLFYACQREDNGVPCKFNLYPMYPIDKYRAQCLSARNPQDKPVLLDVNGAVIV